MDDRDAAAELPMLPVMRWLLMIFTVLTLLGVSTLAIMSERTEQYFAWTIDPPLTAAFLGAGYAAGFVLVALAERLCRGSGGPDRRAGQSGPPERSEPG